LPLARYGGWGRLIAALYQAYDDGGSAQVVSAVERMSRHPFFARLLQTHDESPAQPPAQPPAAALAVLAHAAPCGA
jgi:hypothetical protein